MNATQFSGDTEDAIKYLHLYNFSIKTVCYFGLKDIKLAFSQNYMKFHAIRKENSKCQKDILFNAPGHMID